MQKAENFRENCVENTTDKYYWCGMLHQISGKNCYMKNNRRHLENFVNGMANVKMESQMMASITEHHGKTD